MRSKRFRLRRQAHFSRATTGTGASTDENRSRFYIAEVEAKVPTAKRTTTAQPKRKKSRLASTRARVGQAKGRSSMSSPGSGGSGYRAKIRMYRHGLGDCFL